MPDFLKTLRDLDAKATPGPFHIGQPTMMRPTHTLYFKPFGMGDVAEVYAETDAELLALMRNSVPRIAALVEAVGAYKAAHDAFMGNNDPDRHNALAREACRLHDAMFPALLSLDTEP